MNNFFFFSFFLFSSCVFAQKLNFSDSRFYNAICKQDMHLWQQALDKYIVAKDEESQIHYAFLRYFYVAHLIEQHKHDDAEKLIETIEFDVDKLNNSHYKAEIITLQSALQAFRASISTFGSVYYLSKAMQGVSYVDEMKVESAQVAIERGNFYFHFPSMLGGNYQKAIEMYRKGISLFEKSGQNLTENWYYLNAHIWLAKSYENLGKYDDARIIYDKILRKAPQFVAVARWQKRIATN